MGRDLTLGIEEVYAERLDFLVVALTGRTGSGCSTTAEAMTRSISDLPVSTDGLAGAELRKFNICHNFLRAQWVPFKAISVSTVIFSFLILEEWGQIEDFFKKQKLEASIAAIKSEYQLLHAEPTFPAFEQLSVKHDRAGSVLAWQFYEKPLKDSADRIRAALGNKYAPLFQTLGDNIRLSGSAISSVVNPSKVFALITRVKRIVKAAGLWDRANGTKSTRVVIDAVRNPLELVYLRDQFAAFFAIAVTSDDEDRKARLANLSIPKRDVDALDVREYSKKSLGNYGNFVSQNLQECIQKADLFFRNPGKPDAFARTRLILYRQIVRYVALMLRPGLVTPTPDERCMQLAFVAKLNSGCISRQVGAAVSDAHSSIKAVGWNDVPKGQVPCLLRDVGTLLNSHDALAFSEYETTNVEFRRHLSKKFEHAGPLKTALGLPCPFCFKDAYNTVTDKENQVHTRSLHAEENAFLQLAKYGNSGIEGGFLYTTASPCELCSKKAFQLGIREIVYVDPYPGISTTHVLKSGPEENRPILRLFSGAVGNAYHRLYEPMLPIKDEYMARLADDPAPTLL
ncbi:deoxycytidylate deaminase [Cognatiluteimonas weifangensis]|uniref:Deoxycytidylate deaminase n=1 Tax=Cognatiluteimonas weifangensis TaxID=2303539 RepID=A0A372DPW1_9GAMM|nr:deoxycytidylate deaminase [Luteimonas weifangensis]RFP61628.1 deoxycytidylate deaminase [Luteimonas weifangensis]